MDLKHELPSGCKLQKSETEPKVLNDSYRNSTVRVTHHAPSSLSSWNQVWAGWRGSFTCQTHIFSQTSFSFRHPTQPPRSIHSALLTPNIHRSTLYLQSASHSHSSHIFCCPTVVNLPDISPHPVYLSIGRYTNQIFTFKPLRLSDPCHSPPPPPHVLQFI